MISAPTGLSIRRGRPTCRRRSASACIALGRRLSRERLTGWTKTRLRESGDRGNMHSPFAGEFAGTLVLILLGDGVVANVLLKRSKAEGAGWMVITTAWGLAVFCG